RRTLGDEHASAAGLLNNLALLHVAQGQFAKAEPLLRQAAALDRTALGLDHPDRLGSLQNLASVCAATGQDDEALRLMDEVTALEDRLVPRVRAMTVESARAGFARRLDDRCQWFLSLVLQRRADAPAAAAAALDLLLRRKAL